MNPEKIVEIFATALDHLEPVTEQPSDTDLTRIREAVAPLLLQIPYDETGDKHNLIGLIWSKLAYVARYRKASPECKRVGAYDLEIDDNATAVVRARQESKHKARCAERATFETTRRDTTHILIAVSTETWVRELKDPDTIYREVTPPRLICTPASRVHRPARPRPLGAAQQDAALPP